MKLLNSLALKTQPLASFENCLEMWIFGPYPERGTLGVDPVTSGWFQWTCKCEERRLRWSIWTWTTTKTPTETSNNDFGFRPNCDLVLSDNNRPRSSCASCGCSGMLWKAMSRHQLHADGSLLTLPWQLGPFRCVSKGQGLLFEIPICFFWKVLFISFGFHGDF